MNIIHLIHFEISSSTFNGLSKGSAMNQNVLYLSKFETRISSMKYVYHGAGTVFEWMIK